MIRYWHVTDRPTHDDIYRASISSYSKNVRCLTVCNQVDASTHTLAKYLMELTIVEYDLVHINPSEIAAASLCLAMKLICDTPEWVSFKLYQGCFMNKLQNVLN